MKKMRYICQNFFLPAISLILCCVFSSCQQIDLGNDIAPGNDDKNVVKITSKSGDSGIDIPSPLTVYAVNEDGLVAGRSVIPSGTTSTSLSLFSGDYTFYAVAGADAGNSDVPASNVITAENGYFANPIMRGKNQTTVDDDAEISLTLSIAVASVDVTLSNIPAGVKAVSVKIGTLGKTLNIVGEYDGSTTATLDLAKQSDGTTWKSATVYVFPSVSAPTTLTITQTLADDSKQSYTASYNAKLLAGTPYHFKGTGTSISNHDLTVNVTAEAWDNAIDEELVLTPIGAGDGTGTIDADGETFLVSAMPTESGIAFEGHVLAYIDGDKGLLYAKQDCTQEQIAEYSEGNIKGWSVPTLEQYNQIKSQNTSLAAFAKLIKDMSGKAYPHNDYFYSNNLEKAFSWSSNNPMGEVQIGNSKKVYHLRLVKPVTFKLKD